MQLPALASLPHPRLALRPPRPPARVLIACAAVVALVGGGWLWLRDSRLVAVERVTVTGLSGPEAPRVREALQSAARDMTTLHVRRGELRTAVDPFPAVKALETHPDFPHGLRIVVHEHVAVAALVAGSERVAVAADGTLLRANPAADLPAVAVQAPPAGHLLENARAQRMVALLAAAPPALRDQVVRAYVGPHGLTAPLRDGPVLYFGGSERLRAKWIAATRVLADRSSAGATYLDLRIPERPAAGGLEQPRQRQPTAAEQVAAQAAQAQAPQGP
jgi:cell division protein FtsQ